MATTINAHVDKHGLSSCHQWAYKKNHSTELLLIKMIEDWRSALDNKEVVGIVFVDFRKAFDSIDHSLLLQKLQGLGVAGDLWSWIKDCLTNRTQETRINGNGSGLSTVKCGVPQGSVLGPTLFSLFCNDLPDIVDAGEGDIHIYADDTTIYVIGPTPDAVTTN